MKTKDLRIFGRESNTYVQHLYCECGGEYIGDMSKVFKENEKWLATHTCTNCGNVIYVEDLYPKVVQREIGDFVSFGEIKVLVDEEQD